MQSTTHKSYSPPSVQLVRKSKTLINTGRVVRVLSLIRFLQQWRCTDEVATHLQVSKKTTNRYFNLLLQLGFTLERQPKYRTLYRIQNLREFFEIVDNTEDNVSITTRA